LTQLSFHLTSRPKWALAAGIVCIYLPVRIFVSNNEFTTDIFLNKGPLWFVEFLVNILFFRLWIGVIELIHLFFDWLESTFSARLPRMFFTYIAGLVLAVLFNIAFFFIWVNMALFFQEKFNITIHRSQYEQTAYARRQKSKANTGLTVMAMLATIYMVLSDEVMRGSNKCS
jgi:two-component system LytT family sensor kinase